MKRIAILGSGQVGQVLANGFLKHGYEVMIGTRDIAKLAEWQASSGVHARVGSVDNAVAFADTLVLAVKGTVAKEAVLQAGAQNLAGKTVIDITNPIAETPPTNGVLTFFSSLNQSLMEELQALAPGAHFVKAFNSVGNAFMVNPDFGGLKPTMFICGNNDEAKKRVATILELFGWEAEDMGGVESARAIEPLCMLWCIPGIRNNSWNHAFKLLKA
jgi:predicted dinucleotide-binding enzyme